MAYDDKRGHALLFGGYDGDYRNDMWVWNGEGWNQLMPMGLSPPRRYGHAMAYDTARDRLILFGGYDGESRSDTWEWDGISWTDKSAIGAFTPWETWSRNGLRRLA